MCSDKPCATVISTNINQQKLIFSWTANKLKRVTRKYHYKSNHNLPNFLFPLEQNLLIILRIYLEINRLNFWILPKQLLPIERKEWH